MALLVFNVGSSSLKLTLFDEKLEKVLHAEIKNIHSKSSEIEISPQGIRKKCRIPNLDKAVSYLLKEISPFLSPLIGIGHRFIHGGPKYTSSVRITDSVLRDLETLNELAPLHNPECIAVIKAAKRHFPSIPQVAVFDTAFHRTLPPSAAFYAIPKYLSQKYHIQRYGFHGISHAYLSNTYAAYAKKKSSKLITLHLGNGCSATAILNGKSIETSMGFSPAEGLVMGTRSGDIDFTVLEYLNHVGGKSLKELIHLLNFESGLLGLSEKTSDVKILLEQKSKTAKLAIDIFCHRIIKTIGAYIAILQGVDTLIFSGGIGENAPLIRQKICKALAFTGLKISDKKNRSIIHPTRQVNPIHTSSSSIQVLIIPTNENLFIAKEVLTFI